MEKLCFNLVLEINSEFINADQRIGMRWRQLQKQKLILTIHFYELPENYGFELGDGLIENLGAATGDLLDAENNQARRRVVTNF